MKKILVSFLSVMFLFLFIACDPHSHEYIYDGGYVVKEDKLYVSKICSCGDEKLTLVENGVIATPDTAQEVLDKVTNNEIVYFTDGEYGRLEFRHNKHTSKAYSGADKSLSTELNISELSKTGVYRYARSLENVRLIAAENAVFKDTFDFGTGHVYGDSSYDAVREINCIGTTTSYYSHMFIKDISFENMKFDFTGNDTRKEVDWISLDFNQEGTYLNGLTFKDCSFKGGKTDKEGPAIRIRSELTDTYSNLVIDNCTFDTGYQGVYCQHYTNVTIKDSSFKKFGHNAIAIQSADDSSYEKSFKGEIKILDNTFEGTADRPLRMNYGSSANILVSGNKFTNASDADGEILKITALDSNSNFSFRSNVYDEMMLDDVEENGEKTSIIVKH